MTPRRAIAAAVVMTAAVAGALPAAAAPSHKAKPKAKAYKVGVESDFYDPAKLTVHAGDKVKWVWGDVGSLELHDVTVDTGPADFHSPTKASGSYSYTFKKAGTYKLYCTQHEEDMTMTVIVKKKR